MSSRAQPQHIPEGVPFADEDSQAHMDWMSMLYFMQKNCSHNRLPERYLTYRMETWRAAQRFRDRFSRDLLAPYYGCYHFPGIETPIQLGGPVQQHPH